MVPHTRHIRPMERGEDEKLRATLEPMSSARLRAIAARLPSGGWQPAAIELAERILDERGEAFERISSCPACRGALHTGQLSVRGTLVGFLLSGIGYKHLWFRPDAGGPPEVVLHQLALPRSATRCSDCGLLLVEKP